MSHDTVGRFSHGVRKLKHPSFIVEPFEDLCKIHHSAKRSAALLESVGRVVIGLLPTTGLTLPFISYGRSNLVLTFVMTGILVNIGSAKERVYGAAATDPMVAAA